MLENEDKDFDENRESGKSLNELDQSGRTVTDEEN